MKKNTENQSDNEVRLDKWLWAARFYKTRSIAKAMIEGGKVHYNGNEPKSAKRLKSVRQSNYVKVMKKKRLLHQPSVVWQRRAFKPSVLTLQRPSLKTDIMMSLMVFWRCITTKAFHC